LGHTGKQSLLPEIDITECGFTSVTPGALQRSANMVAVWSSFYDAGFFWTYGVQWQDN
jgi:hypothetical protein